MEVDGDEARKSLDPACWRGAKGPSYPKTGLSLHGSE